MGSISKVTVLRLLVLCILIHNCLGRSILKLQSSSSPSAAPAKEIQREELATTNPSSLEAVGDMPSSNQSASSDPPFWLIIVIPAILIFVVLMVMWCFCAGACRWGPQRNTNVDNNPPGLQITNPQQQNLFASMPEIAPKCPYPLVPTTSVRETRSVDLERQGYTSCSICMSYHLNSPVVTPCNHAFCYVCIVKWLQFSHICPICRVPLASKHLKPFRPSRVDLQAVKKDLVIPHRASSHTTTASRATIIPNARSFSVPHNLPPLQPTSSGIENQISKSEVSVGTLKSRANTAPIPLTTASTPENLDKPLDSFHDIPLNDDNVAGHTNRIIEVSVNRNHSRAEQRQSIALEDVPLRSLEEGTLTMNNSATTQEKSEFGSSLPFLSQRSKSAGMIVVHRISDMVSTERKGRSQLNNNNV